MKNIKKYLIFLFILILGISMVSAHGEETFTQAEDLIDSKLPCNQLSDDQLEIIGDYYMEQMHPGETHETMDQMMGGEGSDTLRQMHINMARSFYCGEHEAMGSGMMDLVMGRTGMMGTSGYQDGGMMNMMGGNYGLMGGSGWFGMSLYSLIYVALAAFVFGLIFWLTYKLVIGDKKRR